MARFDGASSNLGFSDQVADLEEATVVLAGNGLGVEHSVSGNGAALDYLRGEHRASGFVVDLDHLLEAGHGRVDDVIGQDDGEGFVADQFRCHEHGVAETEGLFLAHVGDVDHVGDLLHDLEQVGLAAVLQHFFELVAGVEVVFDSALAAAGDHDDLVAT